MAQFMVRGLDDGIVRALEQRAAKHGRSTEAELQEILRQALCEEEGDREAFAHRAAQLRARLRSSIDSAIVIRADHDRDAPQ